MAEMKKNYKDEPKTTKNILEGENFEKLQIKAKKLEANR